MAKFGQPPIMVGWPFRLYIKFNKIRQCTFITSKKLADLVGGWPGLIKNELNKRKMKMIIKAVMASIVLFATQAFSAEITPPPRFPLEVAPKATMKASPASSIKIGKVSIDFDKTTLGEAIKEIGAGKIQHQGDAGESEYWACYSRRSGEVWEQLWLLSHGEMGGKEHVIGGVAARISSKMPTASCPESENLREVQLDNGLWLGATTEEIKKKYGKPSLQEKQWLHYESKRELVGDPRAKDMGTDKIYERGGVSVRSVSGKIVEIWAMKQTTD